MLYCQNIYFLYLTYVDSFCCVRGIGTRLTACPCAKDLNTMSSWLLSCSYRIFHNLVKMAWIMARLLKSPHWLISLSLTALLILVSVDYCKFESFSALTPVKKVFPAMPFALVSNQYGRGNRHPYTSN